MFLNELRHVNQTDTLIIMNCVYAALENQKAVTAYLKSKRLLPFGFERQHRRTQCTTMFPSTAQETKDLNKSGSQGESGR